MSVIVTWVALVAVTMSVDELPFAIVGGSAVIVTVAAGVGAVTFTTTLAVAFAPTPVAVAV